MLLKFSLIWIPLLTMEISLIYMIFQKKKSFNRNLHNKSKEYIWNFLDSLLTWKFPQFIELN